MVFSCDAVVYGRDPFVETQVLADGVLVADGGADVFKGAADGGGFLPGGFRAA